MDMSILEWARTGLHLSPVDRDAVSQAARNINEGAFKRVLDEVLEEDEDLQGDYVTQFHVLQALRRCGVLA